MIRLILTYIKQISPNHNYFVVSILILGAIRLFDCYKSMIFEPYIFGLFIQIGGLILHLYCFDV